MEKEINKEFTMAQEHESILQLLEQLKIEEFLFETVCRYMDSFVFPNDSEKSTKFYLQYQEKYPERFIKCVKDKFQELLDILFSKMKREIIDQFVDHTF